MTCAGVATLIFSLSALQVGYRAPEAAEAQLKDSSRSPAAADVTLCLGPLYSTHCTVNSCTARRKVATSIFSNFLIAFWRVKVLFLVPHEPLAPLWVARLCRAKRCNCNCNSAVQLACPFQCSHTNFGSPQLLCHNDCMPCAVCDSGEVDGWSCACAGAVCDQELHQLVH